MYKEDKTIYLLKMKDYEILLRSFFAPYSAPATAGFYNLFFNLLKSDIINKIRLQNPIIVGVDAELSFYLVGNRCRVKKSVLIKIGSSIYFTIYLLNLFYLLKG